MLPLTVQTLEVRGVRNLQNQQIRLHPRLTVFAGDNGQGKTNLLESLYLVATGRSFRTTSLAEIPTHGADQAFIEVMLRDGRDPDDLVTQKSLAIAGGKRIVKVATRRPRSLAAFALATPVVLFEPGSLALSQGPAAERRKLMDRIAAHRAAANGGGEALLLAAEMYRRALLQRKRALESGADGRTLGVFEQLMAEHGCALIRARREVVEAIQTRAVAGFVEIMNADLRLTLTYRPRAPEDLAEFAQALAARRMDDARRKTATIGPHLDDLTLSLGGYPARSVASQGQHRALVLALKGAELAAVAEAREVEPVLLLDDVSSELDETRNIALFRFLDRHVGQVILTTTRPELVAVDRERQVIRVVSGVATEADC